MDYLGEYEKILAKVDEKCLEITNKFDFIPCKKGCCDCCMQLFSLSFIEAYYLSKKVYSLPRNEKKLLIKSADKIHKKAVKTPFSKENYFYGEKDKIYNLFDDFGIYLRKIGDKCPFINSDNLCSVYDNRPHNCRIHGYSFDKSTNEVLGCFRYKNICELKDINKRNALLDNNYMFPEIRGIDARFIKTFVDERFRNDKIWYFTSQVHPILNDYDKIDWFKFFGGIKKAPYSLFLQI